MKILIPFATVLVFLMPVSAAERTPAEQLSWTLAVHSYTKVSS